MYTRTHTHGVYSITCTRAPPYSGVVPSEEKKKEKNENPVRLLHYTYTPSVKRRRAIRVHKTTRGRRARHFTDRITLSRSTFFPLRTPSVPCTRTARWENRRRRAPLRKSDTPFHPPPNTVTLTCIDRRVRTRYTVQVYSDHDENNSFHRTGNGL